MNNRFPLPSRAARSLLYLPRILFNDNFSSKAGELFTTSLTLSKSSFPSKARRLRLSDGLVPVAVAALVLSLGQG